MFVGGQGCVHANDTAVPSGEAHPAPRAGNDDDCIERLVTTRREELRRSLEDPTLRFVKGPHPFFETLGRFVRRCIGRCGRDCNAELHVALLHRVDHGDLVQRIEWLFAAFGHTRERCRERAVGRRETAPTVRGRRDEGIAVDELLVVAAPHDETHRDDGDECDPDSDDNGKRILARRPARLTGVGAGRRRHLGGERHRALRAAQVALRNEVLAMGTLVHRNHRARRP